MESGVAKRGVAQLSGMCSSLPRCGAAETMCGVDTVSG